VALQVAGRPDAITLEAIATKVDDRWVVEVAGPPHVSVRVSSLEVVVAAVNRARGTEALRVRIYLYR
jgi:hypothetical protein